MPGPIPLPVRQAMFRLWKQGRNASQIAAGRVVLEASGSVTLDSGSDVLTLVLAPNQPQIAIASSALTLTGVGANLTVLGENIVPPTVRSTGS